MKVLVIGSGPIIIGQAAEFDYAGTQACRALREEGCETVLVNSNPATIMTDPGVADRTYVEPLTREFLELVIARERPDALLAGLGGQTALNLAVELADSGVLDRYGVEILGTPIESIRTAEDRELFKQLLERLGEPVAESVVAHTVADAEAFADNIGLPLIIRPAFTLGGTGGGTAFTLEQLRRITEAGLAASPLGQVLVERSLLGWKEIEYEVMRDGGDTCITICNMENFDPMGVHTGDSIVVAPSQTLTDQEYQMLRSAALRIIRALGVVGGCNVQFAVNPCPAAPELGAAGRYAVVEVNPRVSRSSALASKATGYPIARVTAKIGVGKRLHEIPNAVTQRTTAAFEPALDYLVVKIPRWPFDKFPDGDRRLGTQMKSTGEAMAIDRSFEAALQKAVRSLEVRNRDLLWEDPSWTAADIERLIREPNELRLWALMAALRRGRSPELLAEWSSIDVFFLHKLANIVACERALLDSSELTPGLARRAKRLGFSDRQIGTLVDELPERVRQRRRAWGIQPTYKMVDTCAAEFEAVTPYFYGTYETENEAEALAGPKVVVLGSGPIRIGQGIEFDYCSVRAAMALRSQGIQSIMINSNPETVSTDFDASSRLYFEPLDEESVRDVLENETPDGRPPEVLAQFGGQTAINLAEPLVHAGFPLLGSDVRAINVAEDRDEFSNLLANLGIPQPPGGIVSSPDEAIALAELYGYPVLVRPSFVLGGRAMEICRNAAELREFAMIAKDISGKKPLLVDKYLEGIEIELDAICDGTDVLIPGIMEHVERAGVHSGDSIAIYPAQQLTAEQCDTLVRYTTDMGRALGVRGLFNVQYVVFGGQVYVIEVNPRGSRTVPFLSKVTGVPMVDLAVEVALGARLGDLPYGTGLWPPQPLVAAKAPVFSMAKLTHVDTYLGPEMKSTGEVMGLGGETLAEALAKALIAAGNGLPTPGSAVLLSLADRDKDEAMPLVQQLASLGFDLLATEGTARRIREELGLDVECVTKKLSEGHPNVLDVIQSRRVAAVVNTITGDRRPLRDGFLIRRAATERRIPCFTSLDTLRAALVVHGPQAVSPRVHTIEEYRSTTRVVV